MNHVKKVRIARFFGFLTHKIVQNTRIAAIGAIFPRLLRSYLVRRYEHTIALCYLALSSVYIQLSMINSRLFIDD